MSEGDERGVPETAEADVPDRVSERQRYRLRAYRFVQARMQDEIVCGVIPTTAMWVAVRDACQIFDLDSTDWARLVRSLLVTAPKP